MWNRLASHPHLLPISFSSSSSASASLQKEQKAYLVAGMQNDIHAPGTTVYEALEFSAQMRIMDIDKNKLKDFVDQVGSDSHMHAF